MYQQLEQMCLENKVKLLNVEFVSNIFSCVLFARLKSFYHSKCKCEICRRSSVILWSTLMPLILTEWESMTGLLCWVCSFYLFPLMSGEKEKEKGRETDKQKDEKRARMKVVTAAPYQKNKENLLSRKNGWMNLLHAKNSKQQIYWNLIKGRKVNN